MDPHGIFHVHVLYMYMYVSTLVKKLQVFISQRFQNLELFIYTDRSLFGGVLKIQNNYILSVNNILIITYIITCIPPPATGHRMGNGSSWYFSRTCIVHVHVCLHVSKKTTSFHFPKVPKFRTVHIYRQVPVWRCTKNTE